MIKNISKVLLGASLVLSMGFISCGKEPVKTLDVNTTVTSIIESVELPMGMPLNNETVKSVYNNLLNESNAESFAGQVPMMVSASEVAIVKPVEGKEEDVLTALKSRQETQIKSFERYLPEEYEIIKASEVYEENGYFSFCIRSRGYKS